MAHYNRWLTGLLGLAMLTACSDDVVKPVDPNPMITVDEGDGVYMSVDIKMPTGSGTRSYTDSINSSNSGTEIGKDYENNVNTVYLVLAQYSENPSDNNTFIAFGEIPTNKILPDNNGTTYNTTAKFSKGDLQAYYQTVTDTVPHKVNVFVFCNPTIGLRQILQEQKLATTKSNKWVNETCSYNATDPTAEIIWSRNDFLMSNNSIATRTIPATLDDWSTFTT